MALNKSHADNKGVLIYSGEVIILFCDHVSMEFSGSHRSTTPEMKGTKTGRLYLTTHRIMFNNGDTKDALKSFASPFFCLRKVEIEQPVFGANYIKGMVQAQENGGFYGEVKFKLTFKHGGAIEFGTAMLRVATMATQHVDPAWRDNPPPYDAPNVGWTHAPPPAYSPPDSGYYGWSPPTQTFPDRPPADGVYMYDTPPPYPGLSTNGANSQAFGFNSAANPKAQEAAGGQSAYFDPNNPQFAYVPPPPYSPTAPNYSNEEEKKKQ